MTVIAKTLDKCLVSGVLNGQMLMWCLMARDRAIRLPLTITDGYSIRQTVKYVPYAFRSDHALPRFQLSVRRLSGLLALSKTYAKSPFELVKLALVGCHL